MGDSVGIIVGGAECVWADVDAAVELCAQAELPFVYYACNDMIQQFPKEAHGCTLHPDKLQDWLAKRRELKHARLRSIWTHRHHRNATDDMSDWGGSVSLFATKVALVKYQHKKIILCGAPMVKEAGHFVRRKPWFHYLGFLQGWENHMHEVKPFVRSFSGWTAEKLGKPSVDWLKTE